MKKKNLICGLECEFLKKSDVWTFMSTVSNIISNQYYFSVVDDAVYIRGKRIVIPSEFNSLYLQKLNKMSVSVERLVLHLYPKGISYGKIDSYADFLCSRCEMIVLIYDFCYVEIYCKNQSWTQFLLSESRKIDRSTISEKQEDTDERTEMYV